MKLSIISILIFTLYSCGGQEEKRTLSQPVNFKVNYSVINKDSSDIKEVINFWNNFLNNNNLCTNEDDNWDKPLFEKHPSFIFCFMDDFQKHIANRQITLLSINKIDSQVYHLKTIVTYRRDSSEFIDIDYIFNSFIKKKQKDYKLISTLDWNIRSLPQKKFKEITYFLDSEKHEFNEYEALRLTKFNEEVSKKFNLETLSFNYVICANRIKAYQLLGFDFIDGQFCTNQLHSGFSEPSGRIIVSGNNSEYYPHEVVHLYIQKYLEKENIFDSHTWFEEGIATLFGGSRGLLLNWHLKELKTFLSEHPEEKLNDISFLRCIPNGKDMTDYSYTIGGLICKLVYEKQGMNGLFDLLKVGSTDKDFYKAIENNFNVKKQDFGTFIRAELNKI